MADKHSYRYVDGIRNNDEQVLTEMIEDFLPRIKAFLRSKGVEKSPIYEAEDFFYEGLEVVLDNVTANLSFRLSDTKLYNYIQRVCYNKWIDTLKKEKRDDNMISEIIPDIEEQENRNAIIKAFMGTFEQLKQDCKDVLWFTFVDKMSDKEIAEEKNYTEAYVRTKRFRCKENLKINKKK